MRCLKASVLTPRPCVAWLGHRDFTLYHTCKRALEPHLVQVCNAKSDAIIFHTAANRARRQCPTSSTRSSNMTRAGPTP